MTRDKGEQQASNENAEKALEQIAKENDILQAMQSWKPEEIKEKLMQVKE